MFTGKIKYVALFLCFQNAYASEAPTTNAYWWPQRLDLSPLKNHDSFNPNDKNQTYAQNFKKLDLDALVADLKQLMVTSQDWWPADYGTYAPFFIRMAWHSAGTYRTTDGRGGADGGMQRFAPLNSWPDNTNLDKARRLLWPIKQKYGNQISWSDLMVLAGDVALESMGFKTIGFAGGRVDAWESDNVNWGTEKTWLASQRDENKGKIKKPYGASQMGLIYVNPEGPNGQPDPVAAASHIRQTFGRMAMNDTETVALIAGGHAFGKAHGAADAKQYLGPNPESSPIQDQGFGWQNSYQTGKGPDTITSGLEGAWSPTPTRWSNSYLENLFHFNWVQTKTPSGATQWIPDDKKAANLVPDAYDPKKRHAPMMFTTDLALKADPSYRKISERFLKHPEELEKAFANAWFKLMHRDMGPRSRYLGKLVPKEVFIWQDPVPVANYQMINDSDISTLKDRIIHSGLSNAEMIRVAWASASTFRQTDMRGGANGARIQLEPQKNWMINNPQELGKVLSQLKKIQNDFNQNSKDNRKVSLADLVVLAGSTAIEQSLIESGHQEKVAFRLGRTDATQDMTDVASFAVLKPKADGFRNYYHTHRGSPEQLLVEKASMLNLTVPEMTALIGGLRVLNANYQQSSVGVLTKNPGRLSNDFFINLLDMSTVWKESREKGIYEGVDRKTGQVKWKASAVDLIFGSQSELRAVAEFYAQSDNQEKFIHDFINAWVKVMNLDRFDI
jgi:catalase-peroxidase